MTNEILLWPPTPAPESWTSDTPNEGLYFGDREIYDTFADYQGFYIVEPGEELLFLRLQFAPTKNQEYLAAYKVILEEFECCWHNPLPPEATWEQIIPKIVTRLKEIGWREIVEETEKPNTYFKWKERAMSLEDLLKDPIIWPRPDFNKEELMQFARDQSQKIDDIRNALIKLLLEKR